MHQSQRIIPGISKSLAHTNLNTSSHNNNSTRACSLEGKQTQDISRNILQQNTSIINKCPQLSVTVAKQEYQKKTQQKLKNQKKPDSLLTSELVSPIRNNIEQIAFVSSSSFSSMVIDDEPQINNQFQQNVNFRLMPQNNSLQETIIHNNKSNIPRTKILTKKYSSEQFCYILSYSPETYLSNESLRTKLFKINSFCIKQLKTSMKNNTQYFSFPETVMHAHLYCYHLAFQNKQLVLRKQPEGQALLACTFVKLYLFPKEILQFWRSPEQELYQIETQCQGLNIYTFRQKVNQIQLDDKIDNQQIETIYMLYKELIKTFSPNLNSRQILLHLYKQFFNNYGSCYPQEYSQQLNKMLSNQIVLRFIQEENGPILNYEQTSRLDIQSTVNQDLNHTLVEFTSPQFKNDDVKPILTNKKTSNLKLLKKNTDLRFDKFLNPSLLGSQQKRKIMNNSKVDFNLDGLYGDLSLSSLSKKKQDNMPKQVGQILQRVGSILGLGGEILMHFEFETKSLNLSKQSINLLGALSSFSDASSQVSSIITIGALSRFNLQNKLKENAKKQQQNSVN